MLFEETQILLHYAVETVFLSTCKWILVYVHNRQICRDKVDQWLLRAGGEGWGLGVLVKGYEVMEF